MNAFSTFAFLLLSLLFIGCGATEKPVTLKVTGAFTVGASGYQGGLVAYGDGPGGAKFSVSTTSGKDLQVTLSDGAWNIYVVGWQGQMFGPAAACGQASVNLKNTDKDVNIQVAAANCTNPAFVTKQVKTFSCNAFYNYNQDADTYSLLTAATIGPAGCGSLPGALKESHPFYRLSFINSDGKNSSRGISTGCLTTTSSSITNIPTTKMPVEIRTYVSKQDCEALPVHQRSFSFEFPKGIDVGNRDSFDSITFPQSGSALSLLLPAGKTRRGYSPLMGLIPRILCSDGTNKLDCFLEPIAPAMIDVPWTGNYFYNRPTIQNRFLASHVNQPQCNSEIMSLLNSDSKFSVDNNRCSIEQGNLKANISRNAFLCRRSADFDNVVGLVKQDHKIYHAKSYNSGTLLLIEIYDEKGLYSQTIQLGDGTNVISYLSMSADALGNLYVFTSTNGSKRLTKFTFIPNSPTQQSEFLASSYSTLSSIKSLVVVAPNKIVADDYPSGVKLLTLSESSVTSEDFVVPSGQNFRAFNFVENKVYALSKETSGNNSFLSELNLTNLSTIVLKTFPSQDFSSMSVQNDLIFFGVNSGTASVQTYHRGTWDIGPTYGTGAVSNIVSVGHDIYYINGSTYKTVKYDNNSLTPSGQDVALESGCSATLIGTVSNESKNLTLQTFHSMQNPVKPIFEQAYETIGSRSATPEAFYYFQTLNSDNEYNLGKSSGALGRAEEALSPDGIAGVLGNIYRDLDCSEISTEIDLKGNKAGQFLLSDPVSNQSRLYNYYVFKQVSPKDEYVRNDLVETSSYDINIRISFNNAIEQEESLLKISCTSKLGVFESFEREPDYTRRELIAWNTEDSASAKYEYFENVHEYDRQRLRVSALAKTSENTLFSKTIEVDKSTTYASDYKSARLMTLDKNDHIISFNQAHLGLPAPDFSNDPRASLVDFSTLGNTSSCMDASMVTNPSSPAGSCTSGVTELLQSGFVTEKDLELTIDSLDTEGIDDGVFTIIP